jgi:hypothetical protein
MGNQKKTRRFRDPGCRRFAPFFHGFFCPLKSCIAYKANILMVLCRCHDVSFIPDEKGMIFKTNKTRYEKILFIGDHLLFDDCLCRMYS